MAPGDMPLYSLKAMRLCRKETVGKEEGLRNDDDEDDDDGGG